MAVSQKLSPVFMVLKWPSVFLLFFSLFVDCVEMVWLLYIVSEEEIDELINLGTEWTGFYTLQTLTFSGLAHRWMITVNTVVHYTLMMINSIWSRVLLEVICLGLILHCFETTLSTLLCGLIGSIGLWPWMQARTKKPPQKNKKPH